MESINKSYTMQMESEMSMKLPSRYSAPLSIDNFRHTRMLDLTKPFWQTFAGSEWLTVGDGRYGSDAAYLHSNGVKVTASSLTADKLRYAHTEGFIPEFRAENAEALSLKDNSVDFVLCKEAYHHFPRPPIALYEILRVSRIGVVLIEPLDNPKFLDGLKRLLKRVIRGDTEMQFEKSGNFLYRLNIRELEKLMTAMGGGKISFTGINDFYHPQLGDYDATRINRGSIVTRLGVFAQDVLCKMGLLGYGLGCVVVFKSELSAQNQLSLEGTGFKFIELPKNPYLNT